MVEKRCKKYNSVGDCLEYVEVGDATIIKFKEEAKECDPKKFEEWKKKIAENKIKTMD